MRAKHTPKKMIASSHSLWSDTPLCSHVRMADIVKHSASNGMDAGHLTSEFAKRWNIHERLLELAAEALWKRDYPQGGSIYKTYESLNFHDKEIHRNEALNEVGAS